MKNIVVLGSANTDFAVSVPQIPKPGQTVIGGDLVRAAGGKGANQAVAAARLGAEVVFIGCLGADDLGDAYIQNLEKEGIDTRFVHRIQGRPSGVALIFVGPGGENAIAVAPGANSCLTPEHVDEASSAIAEADCVVAQLEVPLDAVCRAAELARQYDVTFILNPAPAPNQPLPDALLRNTDLLIPNRHEAAAIAGSDCAPEELIVKLSSLGVRTVVMTLGPDGALAASQSDNSETQIFSVPGFKVPAVDATGAGDCFTGALAVAAAEKRALRDAVVFANAAAALSVTKMGAQPSLPTRREVEQFLEEVARL
ncbi:MAG: ribokinase [Armatimonadota bacterium]